MVANFSGHTGPVGTSSTWPLQIGKLGGQLECFVGKFPAGQSFIVNGTSYVGNELRVLAETSSQTIDFKSGLELRVAGIPEVSLASVQSVPLPDLTAVFSRKVHGTAGPFDVVLPLTGTLGIKCRRDPSVIGNHTLVFTFNKDVVSGIANVTLGTGSINGAPTFNGNQMTVNLTGVSDVQVITVTLSNVTDGDGLVMPATTVSMGVLLGDVNGSGVVNSTDIVQVTATSGQTSGPANYRRDINASAVINSTDIILTKSRSGSALPP